MTDTKNKSQSKNRMKLITQLFLVFFVIVVITGGIGMTGLFFMDRIRGNIETLTTAASPLVRLSGEILNDMRNIENLTLEILDGKLSSRMRKEDMVLSIRSMAESGRNPENAQDLQLLFGDEAKRTEMTIREIVDVYEKSYSIGKKARPWWKSIRPAPGWIVAGVLFLLLIFRDILKETITNRIKSVKTGIYIRMAGNRFFLKTCRMA